MKKPVISVVIATYKRPGILSRAIDSVLMQDYSDFEIIVVDDNGAGSDMQKATQKMLFEKYNDDRIVYVANEKGLGGGGARNEGIKRARGEYVAFLDDDEDWLPGKLSKQVKVYSESPPDVGVVDTGFYTINSKGDVTTHLPEMQGDIFRELLLKKLLNKRAPKLSTMLCRRNALIDVGMFDPELRSRQDLDLYIRLAKKYKFVSIPEPLANKREDADERISTNRESKLRGAEILYNKLYSELKSYPPAHCDYLFRYSLLLMKTGHYRKGAAKLLKAFLLMMLNPVVILLLAKKNFIRVSGK